MNPRQRDTVSWYNWNKCTSHVNLNVVAGWGCDVIVRCCWRRGHEWAWAMSLSINVRVCLWKWRWYVYCHVYSSHKTTKTQWMARVMTSRRMYQKMQEVILRRILRNFSNSVRVAFAYVFCWVFVPMNMWTSEPALAMSNFLCKYMFCLMRFFYRFIEYVILPISLPTQC